MNRLLSGILLAIPFAMTAHCSEQPSGNAGTDITISVGSEQFAATLEGNGTAAAFLKLLPLTVRMDDLHGNEKYAVLARTLPTHSKNPGRIAGGDIMLFGSSTLVLFYESFSTSYSYSRIGRVRDPSGLGKALGRGSATVTFERRDSAQQRQSPPSKE